MYHRFDGVNYDLAVYSWLNKKVNSVYESLSEYVIAEFPTNWTEEMQEYSEHIAWRTLSTFWRASARKKSVYILKPCRVVGKDLKKVSEKVGLSRTLKYFQWIIKQLLNSAFVWSMCDELCRSRRMLSTSASVDNILPDLHNSSHPTQPHSIIANYYYFSLTEIEWITSSSISIILQI